MGQWTDTKHQYGKRAKYKIPKQMQIGLLVPRMPDIAISTVSNALPAI